MSFLLSYPCGYGEAIGFARGTTHCADALPRFRLRKRQIPVRVLAYGEIWYESEKISPRLNAKNSCKRKKSVLYCNYVVAKRVFRQENMRGD